MARSWVGLTILACLPCIRIPQSLQSAHSYDKNVRAQEYYECAVMSRKNLGQTRLPLALHHKADFSKQSYGFRPNRSTYDAMSYLGKRLAAPSGYSYQWVIE